MFPPVFPIYIEALIPLHRHAPAIWLSGVVCLWLTRYTHQLGRRWGSRFYVFSAVIRPLGILLIAIGWLALYAPDPDYSLPMVATIGWLPTGNWTELLCWLAIGLFSAFGAWAVLVLGLRRSFLFRRVDDNLITRGPYALVRHPQFLSAIGITFFSVRLYNPAGFPIVVNGGYFHSLDANWALLTLALWVLSILEDRELATHFGEEYEEYARRVPRVLPN
jgi:protein-S-isoprenylcysteine O-methyltransferase Ste14